MPTSRNWSLFISVLSFTGDRESLDRGCGMREWLSRAGAAPGQAGPGGRSRRSRPRGSRRSIPAPGRRRRRPCPRRSWPAARASRGPRRRSPGPVVRSVGRSSDGELGDGADSPVKRHHRVAAEQVVEPLRVAVAPEQFRCVRVGAEAVPRPHRQTEDVAAAARRPGRRRLHQPAVAAGHHRPAPPGQRRADTVREFPAIVARPEPSRAENADREPSLSRRPAGTHDRPSSARG